MKIHTKLVYEFDSDGNLDLIEDESFDYEGEVAHCGGGGSTSSNTVQKSDPWGPTQNYLLGIDNQNPGVPVSQGIMPEAARLYSNYTPQWYQGQQVANFTPAQQQAQQMVTDTATSGTPVTNAAQQQIADTLSGNYLYGGSGFNAAMDAATRRINPQVDSTFGIAGRSGSGLADTAKTQALSDAFANLYAGERSNQIAAAGMSPQVSAMRYIDPAQLAQTGATQQNLAQQNIDALKAKWAYEQNMPYQKLQVYNSYINPGIGGTQSMSTPFYSNPMGTALGIASLGKATGAYGSNGWLASLFGGGAAAADGATTLDSVASAGGLLL